MVEESIALSLHIHGQGDVLIDRSKQDMSQIADDAVAASLSDKGVELAVCLSI